MFKDKSLILNESSFVFKKKRFTFFSRLRSNLKRSEVYILEFLKMLSRPSFFVHFWSNFLSFRPFFAFKRNLLIDFSSFSIQFSFSVLKFRSAFPFTFALRDLLALYEAV